MSKRSKAPEPDRLDYIDQATFLSYRANGRVQVGMALWFYEGPVDLDGLRRFNENFGKGLVARYIERSPLPFGRHRWVTAPAIQRPLDVAETACPRSELSDWLEERAQIPIDPEHGPGWTRFYGGGHGAVALPDRRQRIGRRVHGGGAGHRAQPRL
ncbi:hypothetical protein [Mycolicibacterium sp. CBMA 361]|uniref:hypothetical protein n=1 Tax=Mycolicibacterium sp. CBMA 361 TaxID=2606610 RepID=UPI001EF04B8E|nr:hypothetical protein [Mycolicibacterium sp. CBMA 361]